MCVESLFVHLLHVCDTSILSVTAQSHLEARGVGKALWQGLVRVQCRKPPEVVSTTADELDKPGLKEEVTQLRGWLIFQALVGK